MLVWRCCGFGPACGSTREIHEGNKEVAESCNCTFDFNYYYWEIHQSMISIFKLVSRIVSSLSLSSLLRTLGTFRDGNWRVRPTVWIYQVRYHQRNVGGSKQLSTALSLFKVFVSYPIPWPRTSLCLPKCRVPMLLCGTSHYHMTHIFKSLYHMFCTRFESLLQSAATQSRQESCLLHWSLNHKDKVRGDSQNTPDGAFPSGRRDDASPIAFDPSDLRLEANRMPSSVSTRPNFFPDSAQYFFPAPDAMDFTDENVENRSLISSDISVQRPLCKCSTHRFCAAWYIPINVEGKYVAPFFLPPAGRWQQWRHRRPTWFRKIGLFLPRVRDRMSSWVARKISICFRSKIWWSFSFSRSSAV